MKKILMWIFGSLGVLIAGLVLFILIASTKKYDAPYPDIKASTDPELIERGRYLAYGPANCATCHMPMDKIVEVDDTGIQPPLSGGWTIEIAPGVFRAPNLTPDEETGIGRLTDAEIARTLRYSVGSDGRLIVPFMPFQEMSDEDMAAIISFLRSQEPVRHEVLPSKLSFLGKAVVAFGLIKPEGPKNTPPASVAIDTTVEYGAYIANSVANCRGCHTEIDLKTGAYIGKDFAGGALFEPDPFSNGYSFISPNLTPEKTTGVMAAWTEDFFVERFKAGRVHRGSPMPWGAFSRMNEVEIRAVYRYLQTVEPVARKVEQTVFPPNAMAGQ
jgi:mono/diheme cytochrome c family protein